MLESQVEQSVLAFMSMCRQEFPEIEFKIGFEGDKVSFYIPKGSAGDRAEARWNTCKQMLGVSRANNLD